jgi:hypothetical protein
MKICVLLGSYFCMQAAFFSRDEEDFADSDLNGTLMKAMPAQELEASVSKRKQIKSCQISVRRDVCWIE